MAHSLPYKELIGTNRVLCLLRKTLAKRGKRNCQSSESFYQSGTRTIDRPVAGRRSNPLGHRPPPPGIGEDDPPPPGEDGPLTVFCPRH